MDTLVNWVVCLIRAGYRNGSSVPATAGQRGDIGSGNIAAVSVLYYKIVGA